MKNSLVVSEQNLKYGDRSESVGLCPHGLVRPAHIPDIQFSTQMHLPCAFFFFLAVPEDESVL